MSCMPVTDKLWVIGCPQEIGKPEVKQFLSHLAVERNGSPLRLRRKGDLNLVG